MQAESKISAEDRRAATSVTTSQSGHRFEIQLGHLCNNRCVFCSSGQLTALKIARPVPIEPILEALEQARAAGATHLTFLGGEPTLHKRFLEAVAKAVELGFGHIVIFTNGVMFPHPGFIESVTALGNFEWRISIQGATEEAHVAATGRPDSFRRIVHGLGELQRRGQLVTTNMCVNERSYRSLPSYPALLREYGVRQLHIDIVRPESTGERDEVYLREIMPRYSDMAPYYDEMLAGFEAWDPNFDINIGNLPYCILPKWGARIHHGGQETITKSSDGEGLEDEMNKYEWQASLRTHLPACEGCEFRGRCTGVFRGYLALHGPDEFRAVSRDQLLELDPQRRNFVLLLEPSVARVRAAANAGEIAAGWSLERVASDERRRRIGLDFVSESGTRARIVVLPAETSGGVAKSAEWSLALGVDGPCRELALRDLITRLVARLASSVEDAAAVEFDEAALLGCIAEPLFAKGRARVDRLSRRLQLGFGAPGWHVGSIRWRSEFEATLTARGNDGGWVDVLFSLSAGSEKAHLGVDFRFGSDPGDEARARPAIDAIIAVLRSPTSRGAGL